MLSIVTVCFNAEQVIRKTIENVLGQTYSPQYLILDGNSKDKTPEIIQEYAQKLYYWHSQNDEGIYDAMQQAVSIATGEWICFLNAGDYFCSPTVLEKIAQAAQESGADVIYGDYWIVYKYFKKYKKVPPPDALSELFEGMCLNHQSLFVRKKLLEKFPFEKNYPLAADFGQILQIYLAGHSFHYLDFAVACFADGGASSIRKLIYLEQCQQIVKKYVSPEKSLVFDKKIIQTKKIQRIAQKLPAWLFEGLMFVKNKLKIDF